MDDRLSRLRKKSMSELTIWEQLDIIRNGEENPPIPDRLKEALDRGFSPAPAVKSNEPRKTEAVNLGAPKKRPPKLSEKVRDLTQYFDQANLTEAQREAISLRLEYALSVNAISKRLGISRPAVDERIRAASKKIEENRSRIRRSAARPRDTDF